MLLTSLGLAITPSTCPALGKAIVEHACIHAQHGPFGDPEQTIPLPAREARVFPEPTPHVNKPHTLHRVTLPAGKAEGTVKFTPARSGHWAVFRNPAVSVQLVDAAGTVLPWTLEHDVVACALLPRVSVAPLTAGTTYRLVLAAAPGSETSLALERAEEFTGFYFQDADGDGHGDPRKEVETACVPPAGTVETDDDCDDARAATHPGAPELCNGIDDDCDRMVDESCVPAPDGGPGDAAPAGGPPSHDGGSEKPDAKGGAPGCQLGPGQPAGGLVWVAVLLLGVSRTRRPR